MKKIILSLLLLAACSSSPPVLEGKVVERKFEPAHWEGGYEERYEYGYTCGLDVYGDYSCGIRPYTDSVYVAQHRWVNDSYRLRLQKCELKDGEEKCRAGWVSVTESDFDRFSVGSNYPNPR